MKYKILCVDDDRLNLNLYEAILTQRGYEVVLASRGQEALEFLRDTKFDLIILDVMMPEMNGFEVCQAIREGIDSKIPIIMVTAFDSRELRLKGLNIGANDFLYKPLDTAELVARVKNLLKIKEFEDFIIRHNEILVKEVEEKTKELRTALEDLKESKQRLRESYIDTIFRLSRVAEYKDEQTATHINRVSKYCGLIAKNLGWADEEIQKIACASPMHDIGKIGIPSEILLKTSELTREEFDLMKTHTTIGGRILQGSPSEIIQLAERIALSHHEKWDGSGYPKGLKGEEIPVEGRIMIIADQYDALRSRRPYKPPYSHKDTVKILSKGDERTLPQHFDPRILELFLDLHREFDEIFGSENKD